MDEKETLCIRENIEKRELELLSPYAAKSVSDGKRRFSGGSV